MKILMIFGNSGMSLGIYSEYRFFGRCTLIFVALRYNEIDVEKLQVD